MAHGIPMSLRVKIQPVRAATAVHGDHQEPRIVAVDLFSWEGLDVEQDAREVVEQLLVLVAAREYSSQVLVDGDTQRVDALDAQRPRLGYTHCHRA